MEFDEREDEIEKQELISNLDLIDKLRKEEFAVNELLLRQQFIDCRQKCSAESSLDSLNLKPISPKQRKKELEDKIPESSWGHGTQEQKVVQEDFDVLSGNVDISII